MVGNFLTMWFVIIIGKFSLHFVLLSSFKKQSDHMQNLVFLASFSRPSLVMFFYNLKVCDKSFQLDFCGKRDWQWLIFWKYRDCWPGSFVWKWTILPQLQHNKKDIVCAIWNPRINNKEKSMILPNFGILMISALSSSVGLVSMTCFCRPSVHRPQASLVDGVTTPKCIRHSGAQA